MKTTQAERLQQIAYNYRDAGQTWPATAKMIAAWAIREKLWTPRQRDYVRQCAREISAALRQEYFTDPQGRRVRRKHVIREFEELPDGTYKQLLFWVDIDDATKEEMEGSFQLRRTYIMSDCERLKTEVDSYNENHDARIQMSFNFTPDLRELAQPTIYQPVR